MKKVSSTQNNNEPQFYVMNCCGRKGTLIYNSIWFIFLVIFHIINVIISETYVKTHFFLTNVGLIFSIVYLAVSIIYLSKGAVKDSTSYKWVRAFHSVAMTAEGVVILFYWPAVAPSSIPKYDTTCNSELWCYIYTSIAHGFILIPTWGPLFGSWIEMKISDLGLGYIFTLVYSFFMLIPYTLWVDTLYDVLTFKDTMSFVYFAAAYGLVLISFFVAYWIYTCRRAKFVRIYGKSNMGGVIEVMKKGDNNA